VIDIYYKKDSNWPNIGNDLLLKKLEAAKELDWNEHIINTFKFYFKALTDEQRLDIFSDYCRHCGTYDKDDKCCCGNDV